MRPAPAFALTALLLACGGAETGDDAVPAALRAQVRPEEAVAPFGAWTVPGLRLYRVSGAVPDRGWSYLVGVDEGGALVRGPALLARLEGLSPAELARRASDVLDAAGRPLSPDDERPSFASEREWALVTVPTREGGTLVYFAMQGEMAPRLVEQRIDTVSWEVRSRPATELLLERGEAVPVGGPRCEPLARCGCWDGCAAFQLVRLPGEGDPVFRRVEARDGPVYVRRRECGRVGGREVCAEVCRAPGPTAHCDDPLQPRRVEPCTEACPPSRAPYRCDLFETGCRAVPHAGG